ncbi:MAG: TOBE domain-containing protein, partial [Actinobacteria bacterium]|nr:TOBE domain-containing protein [Actinomycetota bacterium]
TADFIGAGNFIDLASVKLNKNIYELTTETGGSFILEKAANEQNVGGHGINKSFSSSAAAENSTENGQLVFFIRPEKIKISREDRRGKNSFKGIISSVIFEGPDIRLEIQSPDTGSIKIEVKNDGPLTDYAVGKDIGFYWNTDTGILLEN